MQALFPSAAQRGSARTGGLIAGAVAKVILAAYLLLSLSCAGDSGTDPTIPTLEAHISTALPLEDVRATIIYNIGPILELGYDCRDSASSSASSPREPIYSHQSLTPTIRATQGLLSPVPNPFQSSTVLRYGIGQDSFVRVAVHDYVGREVRRLVDSRQLEGEHAVTWNGRDANSHRAPNGLYRITLTIGEGDSAEVQSVDAFLLSCDPSDLSSCPAWGLDDRGRFEIPLEELPIGEQFDIIDEQGNVLGHGTIPSSLRVCAAASVGDTVCWACASAVISESSQGVRVDVVLPQ